MRRRHGCSGKCSDRKLVIESTIKNALTGRLETQLNTVYGPTAVFETTTNPDTDPETKSRYVLLSVDESPEQTCAILEAQRHSHTLEGRKRRKAREAVLAPDAAAPVGLRLFFEHLENTDAVLMNPHVGLILPKFEDRLPRGVLTQAEARRLLDAPDTQTKKGIRDKAILELFYSTGIRGEEMAALTIHDVDCKAGFVRVTKGKFAKDRVVPMGAKATDCVREYLAKVRLSWSQHQKDERALWLSSFRPHQPVKKQAIAAMVKEYKKRGRWRKSPL